MKPTNTQFEDPRARVFISCGQAKGTPEVEIAAKIERSLSSLGFDPYVAVGEQSLRGLKENVFAQLARSEYFLFIDFRREPLDKKTHRGSLFSHQELAVASFLELEVLAFREEGVKKNDGILQFIQENAAHFSSKEQLPGLVSDHVKGLMAKGKWNPRWRNELTLERDAPPHLDALDVQNGAMNRYFHITVRNRHRNKTAINCFAYLEGAISLDSGREIPFKPFELKWEGYTLPNAHILASRFRNFDAICIRHSAPTDVLFYGFRDASYFLPKISRAGRYELQYLVVADNFSPARRSFVLDLGNSHSKTALVPRKSTR